MGGPIIRTGTTPEFWKNWDKAFGAKPSAGGAKKAAGKKAAKAVKPKAAKKAVASKAGSGKSKKK